MSASINAETAVRSLEGALGRFWVLAIILIFAALLVASGEAYRYYEEHRRDDWKSTTAIVLDTEAYEYFKNTGYLVHKRVIYAAAKLRYEVEGQAYETTADVHGIGDPAELEERFPRGETVWIFYDPGHPDRIYFNASSVERVYTNLNWLAALLTLLAGLTIYKGKQTRS